MKALNDFAEAVNDLEKNRAEPNAQRAYWTSRHYFAVFYDLALATNGRYNETIDEFIETSQKGLRVLKEIAQTQKLEWVKLLGHRIALHQKRARVYKEGGLEAVSAELKKEKKIFEEGYKEQERFPIILQYDFEGVN